MYRGKGNEVGSLPTRITLVLRRNALSINDEHLMTSSGESQPAFTGDHQVCEPPEICSEQPEASEESSFEDSIQVLQRKTAFTRRKKG